MEQDSQQWRASLSKYQQAVSELGSAHRRTQRDHCQEVRTRFGCKPSKVPLHTRCQQLSSILRPWTATTPAWRIPLPSSRAAGRARTQGDRTKRNYCRLRTKPGGHLRQDAGSGAAAGDSHVRLSEMRLAILGEEKGYPDAGAVSGPDAEQQEKQTEEQRRISKERIKEKGLPSRRYIKISGH